MNTSAHLAPLSSGIHSLQNLHLRLPCEFTPTSDSTPSTPSAFKNISWVISTSSPWISQWVSAGHSTPTPDPPRVVSYLSNPSSEILSSRSFMTVCFTLGFRRVIEQPPPPAPVSLVQPIPAWSINSLMRSNFGCETPSDIRIPWLIRISSPSLTMYELPGCELKSGSDIMSCASLVILSMVSNMELVMSLCEMRRLWTLATCSDVRRGCLVLTSSNGNSGKLRPSQLRL